LNSLFYLVKISFEGEIIHSIKYKSAKYNNLVGKNVLIVGIGNSAVDIAVNLVNEGW
jgi:cation diffusion facilitator CzcD-associated flavoprotein CzcO